MTVGELVFCIMFGIVIFGYTIAPLINSYFEQFYK